ncbi:MAG: MraZ protein [Myxococcota bacterium]|jgi:MraZ protein
MLRVRCQANATVDAKGRLALPAPIRRALVEAEQDQLVLTFHKGAVWGWTLRDFEERVERPLSDADPFDDQVMDFVHSLLSPAQDVDVDGQGRIRVPPPLRSLAGIERDVVVHSVMHRIEIWDRSAWDQRFKQSLHRTGERSGMPGSRR